MPASQQKSHYCILTVLNELEIEGDLGKGDQIIPGLYITNSRETIMHLLNRELRNAIGGLEYENIEKAKAIVYYKAETDCPLTNPDALQQLVAALNYLGHFLDTLWMVKDNSIYYELGYIQVFPPSGPTCVSSNFLVRTCQSADGLHRIVKFTREEMRIARLILQNCFLPFVLGQSTAAPEADSVLQNRMPILTAQAAIPRLTRAIYFISLARMAKDLGVKVAMYCTMLETLFSTDASEIVHKIAHRVSLFLRDDLKGRKGVFAKVKKAYSIRSKVIHGDTLGKDAAKEIQNVAIEIDAIVREILVRVLSSEALVRQFEAKKENLDNYFLESSFNSHVPSTKTVSPNPTNPVCSGPQKTAT